MSIGNGESVNPTNVELKGSLVVCRTSQGMEIRAALVRLTRFTAVFEIYSPGIILRTSEVLSEFKIITEDRAIYSGRAVVANLIDMGAAVVCETTLEDAWLEPEVVCATAITPEGADFADFLQQWQKVYKVNPEFKIVVADMQTFLTDLRLWLEQVELGIRSAPSGDRVNQEKEVAAKLGQSTTPALTHLFERFEDALANIDKELRPVHQTFGRRQLHPMLLCSPFLYRTFYKPLGYAGDYEMVNMIVRDPFEGASLYAKIINLWFLKQAPAEAHRNRIDYLTQQLSDRVAQAVYARRPLRILNLGCGPAHEVQKFLQECPFADTAQFTLLDFNSETIGHAQAALEQVRRRYHRNTRVGFVKKSVHQILKESGKCIERLSGEPYDLIYCAGLFDYLTDSVCKRLTDTYYEWLAPGGLLITTNVDVSNPRRITMDYIMEWHLNYRSGLEFSALKPTAAPPDLCSTKSDETGVNIYFEAKKPARA